MYQEHTPDPRLSHLVECYWTSTGYINSVVESRILPDGCVDIVFTFNGENGQSNQRHINPRLVGTMTSYTLFTYTKKIDMMGIRFNPGAIRAFARMPIDEITNAGVELQLADTIFGKHAFEALPEKKTTQERISYINDYLIHTFGNILDLDSRIIFTVNKIKGCVGNIAIETLSEQACLSQRQLERRFKSVIGVSPKVFSRVIKFRNAVERIQTRSFQNLYEAAMACGYYDHAHLIKEFKAFSGKSPLAYM